jgi:UrcA family protein
MLKTIPALAALGVSAMLLVPTATQAQDLPTARVSYADLDLASDVGQHSLIRRMTYAADQLCGVGKWKQIGLVADASACSKDTLAGAQPAYEQAVASARRGTVIVGGAAALIITRR